MCSDEANPIYFGAELNNSFTADLQTNVMARLWLFCLTTRLLPMLLLAKRYLGPTAECASLELLSTDYAVRCMLVSPITFTAMTITLGTN